MENQINVGDQNTRQIGQSTVKQPMQVIKEQKIKYLAIWLTILVGFIFFGLGGYYVGKQSSKNVNESKLNQTTPSPIVNKNNKTLNLKTYKNVQYGLEFDYPQSYTVSINPDCSSLISSSLINGQASCLLSLTINPTNNNYTPKAYLWLLKGINSVNIPGQVSSIRFNSQKKTWVLEHAMPPAEVLSIWDHTKLGQEIIKSSNGGSHGSSFYYIIPEYENDEVAIFSIPQSYRLRCDNFVNDKSKEADCNNFYKSTIDQYNKGEATVDTWLPENYLSSTYSEAESMIKSYKDIASGATKAISILETIPEIQNIEKSVIKEGRKPFYTPEGIEGDVMTVSLRESFPDDPHTSRIDTFNVNITTRIITVEDVVSGGQISLEEWKKKTNQSWGF